jgi:hypothetical protein
LLLIVAGESLAVKECDNVAEGDEGVAGREVDDWTVRVLEPTRGYNIVELVMRKKQWIVVTSRPD